MPRFLDSLGKSVTLRLYDTCGGLAEMRGPSTGPELAAAYTQSVHHLAPRALLFCSGRGRRDPENIEGVKAGSNVLHTPVWDQVVYI